MNLFELPEVKKLFESYDDGTKDGCPVREVLADLRQYCTDHGIDFEHELEASGWLK